jgi:protein PsiE
MDRETEKKLIRRVLIIIEQFGLLTILIATLVAMGQEVVLMVEKRHVHLSDLLLLFIYLEVITMIGIYYTSNRLPVRYPLYIAIVALARYIILDSKDLVPWGVLALGVTILILTISVFLVRIGHTRFPYDDGS